MLARAECPFEEAADVDYAIEALESRFEQAGWEADTVRLPFAWGDEGAWTALRALDLSRTPMNEPVDLLLATDLPTGILPHPRLRTFLLTRPPRITAIEAPSVVESLRRWDRCGATGWIASHQIARGLLEPESALAPLSEPEICHPPLATREPEARDTLSAGYLIVIDPGSRWRTDLVLASLRTSDPPPVRWIVSSEDARKRVAARVEHYDSVRKVDIVLQSTPRPESWGGEAIAVVDLRPRRELAFQALAALARGIPVVTSVDSGATRELVETTGGGVAVAVANRDTALRWELETVVRDPRRLYRQGRSGNRVYRDYTRVAREIGESERSRLGRPRIGRSEPAA